MAVKIVNNDDNIAFGLAFAFALKMDYLIVMDIVCGLADKSNNFASFLTVLQKIWI